MSKNLILSRENNLPKIIQWNLSRVISTFFERYSKDILRIFNVFFSPSKLLDSLIHLYKIR